MAIFSFASTGDHAVNFQSLQAINWSAGNLVQTNTSTMFSGVGFSIDFDGLRTTGHGVFTGSGGTVDSITIRISDGVIRDTYTFKFFDGIAGSTVGSWGATGSTEGFLSGLMSSRDDIWTGDKADYVLGYGGNDVFSTSGGNDTVFAGPG